MRAGDEMAGDWVTPLEITREGGIFRAYDVSERGVRRYLARHTHLSVVQRWLRTAGYDDDDVDAAVHEYYATVCCVR